MDLVTCVQTFGNSPGKPSGSRAGWVPESGSGDSRRDGVIIIIISPAGEEELAGVEEISCAEEIASAMAIASFRASI